MARWQRTLSLLKCSIGISKPFPASSSSPSPSPSSSSSSSASSSSSLASVDLKVPKYKSKKKMWKCLAKLVSSDKTFSPAKVAVLTIKPRRGKSCFLMFSSLEEAETWKCGLEEGAILVEAAMKDPKRTSRRSKALEQASDVVQQTRMFFKSQSLLKIPFGLRWEAYPPLFKVRQSSPHSFIMSKEASISTVSAKIDMYDDKKGNALWPDLATLDGCTDFLRSSCLNFQALEQATLMVYHFKGSYQMGDADLPDEFRLEAWKGTTRRIVQALVDQLIANNPSLEPCLSDEEHREQLWSASEVWVFSAVHDKIMGACKQMFTLQDASMDSILSKLEKVDPAKLGVRAEFELFVIGEAMDEFRLLNRLRSPYEKALCLQKTVRCIVDGIQNLIKSCSRALNDAEGLLPCTDDLLSFMLLLMARAKVKYLHANACYMENFINLYKDTNRGELMYHITNFVVACNYLLSDDVRELVLDISNDASDPNNGMLSSPILRRTQPSLGLVEDNLRSASSSFVKSASSASELETRVASSRNDSLESNTNLLTSRDYMWEEALPSLDREAFSQWRNSERCTSGEDEFRESGEGRYHPKTRLTNCKQSKENSVEAVVFETNQAMTHWKGSFTHLGDSPDFLLASTYQ